MRRRLQLIGSRPGEEGVALASVILILFVVLAVSGTAATLAVRSASEADRDRDSARAFQLADSAIDVSTWHMNRHLTSADVGSLIGQVTDASPVDGCLINGGASGDLVVFGQELDASVTWCELFEVPDLAAGETAVCYVDVLPTVDLNNAAELVFNPATGLNDLVRRTAVCQGEVDGAQRRIMAKLVVQIDSGAPATLFRREAWVECTGDFPNAVDPSEGCPTV